MVNLVLLNGIEGSWKTWLDVIVGGVLEAFGGGFVDRYLKTGNVIMGLSQLIEILENAQKTSGLERVIKIKKFQEIVWDDKTIQDETLNDILSTLAYDFDYYEPNENIRDEDASYYGDEKLEQELKPAIAKLKEYE